MDPMNDEALDRELTRALAVDPSPEFLARTRARIAEEATPGSRRSSWLFAGAATALAAAAVTALLMVRPDQRLESGSGQLISHSLTRALVVPAVSETLDIERRTSNLERGVTNVERRTANGEPERSNVERHVSRPLFDQGETKALQRLIAAVRDRRVDLSPLLKEAPLAPMEFAPIADIVIAPIIIEPIAPVSGEEGVRP